MVKLAQHIEWPSQLPSRASEGVSSEGLNAKKVDRLLSNGKPRKTLAELFEAMATPSTPPPTTLPSSAPASSSSSSLSSALLPALSEASSACTASLSTSSFSTTLSSLTTSSSSVTAPARVTFDDKPSAIHHTPSAYRSFELAASIKRSSSARKITDSSVHESFHSPKRISKSGPLPLSEPLPRNPLTNTSNSDRSRRTSPAKLSKGHLKGKPNENLDSSSGTLEQERTTPSSYSSNPEQRYRSPIRTPDHKQRDFFPKSIDFVGGLQNHSRLAKGLDAEHMDKVLTMQGTPTKAKKSRRGLFALLAEGVGMKHSGSEVSESKILPLRVAGNPGKATEAKPSGGETRGFLSSPRKVSGNVEPGNKLVDDQMQHLGSWMYGNVGNHEVGREANTRTIEIPDKMVGLAWLGTIPRLLSSGTYRVPSEGFMLEQIVSEWNSYVKHGMLHRVRIPEGHLGVAWVDGRSVLLEEGVSVHMCPSNKFSFITTDDKMIAEKEFVLGPFRVVTVHDSEVGIKFCNRQPQILYTGRHCLSISKVEVFAGFESLLRRQSTVREASALSSDNVKVSADVRVEWQIKAEDAAAARLANITDVEGALCTQVRRAFNLVIWEVNANDLQQQLTGSVENTNTDSHLLLKTLSSNVHRECRELFEESWTVMIWDLQVRQLVILPEDKDAQG